LNWFYTKMDRPEIAVNTRHLSLDATVMQEIRIREKALAELVREAQLQDAEFLRLRTESGMTVAELRSVLAPDETVIEYYFDEESLKIFVIDQENLEVVESQFSPRDLNSLMLQLALQCGKFHFGESYIGKHSDKMLIWMNACLHNLYLALFAPIAHVIRE